ncbi:MAG: acyl-CoA dehydrogenase [Syntrophomonadaceae bacterium]|jgi:butyryl-CoA dehydrogenase|nr:acyl-CoA dehydrogenase [Syntrophomonadaceae bacterium]
MEKVVSRRNIKFLLYEVFGVEDLTKYEYFEDHSQETFDMIIDTAYKLGMDFMYPVFQEMDANPPEYVDGIVKTHPIVKTTMRDFGRDGWINAPMAYEYGGQQIPQVIQNVIQFIFTASNYSLGAYVSLTRGAADLIVHHGSQEQKDLYLEKMFAGEWQGTMALTEPDAGSSLSDIKTSAEDTGEGYYKIKGQKIFISAGDTDAVDNTIHMMLGRIKGAPAGVKGISLFIVPKYRIKDNGDLEYNDVFCAGIEHKLGYKGSPICQLSMGDEGDCRGYLVGEANKGLAYMFQMMNEKRIGVGIGATGKATAAYYAALEYANQRLQGRPLNEKDPNSPQIPIIKHADVKRMLLFQRAICEGALSLALQNAKYRDLVKVGEDAEKFDLISDLMIPVVKTYPSEMGILTTSTAIQCLGGYGFCRDFPVEQYYRDIRIDTLHEGTTGVQGQDLLGRKVTMKGGKAYQLAMEEVRKTIEEAASIDELKAYAAQLKDAQQVFSDVTDYLLAIKETGDKEKFQADASVYLEMAGVLFIGWQWLLQAVVAIKALPTAIDVDKNFYQGKLMTCQYFFKYEMPKLESLGKTLKTSDGLTVAMNAALFED